MSETKTIQVIELARQIGALRPRDLDAYDIPRHYLWRMAQRGQLIHRERGLYMLPDAEITEHHSLVEASKKAPQGIICLLSALRFHELTTQDPFEVWMAIGEKAWQPRIDVLQMRFVRFSGPALREGIETHTLEGVPIKIYGPAKTVADCFKYRNKIGLDVALEALRDCLSARDSHGKRLCTIDDLWHYAEICRVAQVMKPYFEAILV